MNWQRSAEPPARAAAARPGHAEAQRAALVRPVDVAGSEREPVRAEASLHAGHDAARPVDAARVNNTGLERMRRRLPAERVFIERRPIKRILAFQRQCIAAD